MAPGAPQPTAPSTPVAGRLLAQLMPAPGDRLDSSIGERLPLKSGGFGATSREVMAKRNGSKSKGAQKHGENLCSFCLFFQPQAPGCRPLRGNCSYHKEWIENASLTTCSDMSSHPLEEKGIYRLVANGGDGWLYIRREVRLRTRLFLVK